MKMIPIINYLKQVEKLKSPEMKDDGWRGFANRQMDICNCKVAFATEKAFLIY